MKGTLANRIPEIKQAVFTLNPPFPDKQLHIEITNICNHSCIFCSHKTMTRDRGFINEDFLFRILQEAYDLGVREVGFQVAGDSFACEDFGKYVRKAKDVGFRYVFVTTNLALATPNKLKEVFDAGLDSIKISINAGSRETYKLVHGSDDFETVRENIVKLCIMYVKNAQQIVCVHCSGDTSINWYGWKVQI